MYSVSEHMHALLSVCVAMCAGMVFVGRALPCCSRTVYRCYMAVIAHKLSFRLVQAHNVNTVPFSVMSYATHS